MENCLCLGEASLIPSKMMDKFEISSIHVERKLSSNIPQSVGNIINPMCPSVQLHRLFVIIELCDVIVNDTRNLKL